MKKLRSGWLNDCPLQLAPIPLKRLLSETNSLQLERPNSRPLQLDRLRDDSCSEPNENELTPSEPNAVSQLEVNRAQTRLPTGERFAAQTQVVGTESGLPARGDLAEAGLPTGRHFAA